MTSKYTALKDHETPIKVLFTGYLCAVGIGYFFALIQILFTVERLLSMIKELDKFKILHLKQFEVVNIVLLEQRLFYFHPSIQKHYTSQVM